MDTNTQTMLDNFLSFLTKEVQEGKQFKHKHVTMGDWSLKDFKVSVTIFLHNEPYKIFFDLREIKENQNHFGHLLASATDQITKINEGKTTP